VLAFSLVALDPPVLGAEFVRPERKKHLGEWKNLATMFFYVIQVTVVLWGAYLASSRRRVLPATADGD